MSGRPAEITDRSSGGSTRLLSSGSSLADKLRLAASKGQQDKVELLLSSNASFIPDKDGRGALHFAAQNGYQEICRILINHGCEIDMKDAQGNAALHEAARSGFSSTAEVLVKHNCNIFTTDMKGCSALHLAAQYGHNQTSRVLLYAGIHPDMKNSFGDTALHTAARYGHAGVTRILISANCKINEQNKNGDTVLHIVCAIGRRKLGKMLLAAGIKTTLRNRQNESAADVAKRTNQPEMVMMLATHQQGDRGHQHPAQEKRQFDKHLEGPTVYPDGEIPGKEEGQQQKKGKRFFLFKRKKSKKKKSGEEGGLLVTTQPRVGSHPHPPVMGLFSEYTNKPGYQYYKDLAGNVKQGPVGFAPSCQCKPAIKKLEDQMASDKEHMFQHIDASQQVLKDRIDKLDKRTTQQVHAFDKLAKDRFDTEQVQCRDRILHYLDREREQYDQRFTSHRETVDTDLKDWVEKRLQESMVEPVNKPQDDSGLYNREIFNGGQPVEGRLYRTRSDETLSQSDYSVKKKKFHFYESRQAAMQTMRAWKAQDYHKNRRPERQSANLPNVRSSYYENTDMVDFRERSKSSHQIAQGQAARTTNNGRSKSSHNLALKKNSVIHVVQADIHKSQDYMDERTIVRHELPPGYPRRPNQVPMSNVYGTDHLKTAETTFPSNQGSALTQTAITDHSIPMSTFSRLEPSPVAYCPRKPSLRGALSPPIHSRVYTSSTGPHSSNYVQHSPRGHTGQNVGSKPPSSLTLHDNYGQLNVASQDNLRGMPHKSRTQDDHPNQLMYPQNREVTYHPQRTISSVTPQTSARYMYDKNSPSSRPLGYGSYSPEGTGYNRNDPQRSPGNLQQPVGYSSYGAEGNVFPRNESSRTPGNASQSASYGSYGTDGNAYSRNDSREMHDPRSAVQSSPQTTHMVGFVTHGKDDSGSNPDSGYSSRAYWESRMQSTTPSPRNVTSPGSDWSPSNSHSDPSNVSPQLWNSGSERVSPIVTPQSHYSDPSDLQRQQQQVHRTMTTHIQNWYQRQVQYNVVNDGAANTHTDPPTSHYLSSDGTINSKSPSSQFTNNNNQQPYDNSKPNTGNYSNLHGSDV